jgi:hypothetical protein
MRLPVLPVEEIEVPDRGANDGVFPEKARDGLGVIIRKSFDEDPNHIVCFVSVHLCSQCFRQMSINKVSWS